MTPRMPSGSRRRWRKSGLRPRRSVFGPNAGPLIPTASLPTPARRSCRSSSGIRSRPPRLPPPKSTLPGREFWRTRMRRTPVCPAFPAVMFLLVFLQALLYYLLVFEQDFLLLFLYTLLLLLDLLVCLNILYPNQ